MPVKSRAIVKGDSKSASIAAASILAKVHRDRLMNNYAKLYPQYGFERNKGYGTAEHLEAIQKYGISQIHRKTFEPIKSMFEKEHKTQMGLNI
jgi:ribonuclease HII